MTPYNDELLFEQDFVKYLYTACGWEKNIIKKPTEEDLIVNWAQILFDNNKDADHLNGHPLTKGEMHQIVSIVDSLKSPYKLNQFINGGSVTINRDNPDDPNNLGKPVLSMPIIRLAAVSDKDNTMIISGTNPLQFTIEIISGSLKIGDEVQICTRQLFTYKENNKRKYKLRKQWGTRITDSNVHDRFIFVSIAEGMNDMNQRLFKTNDLGDSTFSPLYIRVRRPIYAGKTDVDGYFSNIITVWKKYNMSSGRILIK